MVRKSTIVLVASLLCACQTIGRSVDQDAVIVNPDRDSMSALNRALMAETGTEVTVADHALTNSSILSLEVDPPRALNGNTATGRIMQPPIRFRLVKNSNDCVLIDERDQSRTALVDTRCEVVE